MSEYKNGVNFRGNMSVEKNNVNPDVQTGRAIFVDEDKYEKDSVYKAKVDKCLAEGFHKVGESGGGGSSDFSTAQVTVVNNYSRDTGIQVALVDSAISGTDTLDYANTNTTITISAILYKGYAFASINTEGDYSIEVEGDAEIDGADITITGDCTITIS